MKYMLLIYSPENAWTNDEWHKCVADSTRVCQQLNTQNQLIDAAPLHPVATGVTVRVREEKTLVTAGPFAETIEQLGGNSYLHCVAEDGALLAAHLPGQTAIRRGDAVNVIFRPDFTHLFRKSDGAAQNRLVIGEAV